MRKFYVYFWSHPDTNVVMYIGKGCATRYCDLNRSLYLNGKHIHYNNLRSFKKRIMFYNLTSEEAIRLERILIIYVGSRFPLLNRRIPSASEYHINALDDIKVMFPEMKYGAKTKPYKIVREIYDTCGLSPYPDQYQDITNNHPKLRTGIDE